MNTARVLKRSPQACDNCRRKKTKCPGQRPICSSCSRLNQTCRYANFQDDQQPSTTHLATRLSRLEERLNTIATTASQTVPSLTVPSHFRNGSYTASSPSEDHMIVIDPSSPLNTARQGHRNRRLFPQDFVSQAVRVYFRCCQRQPLWLFDSESDVLDGSSEEVISIVLALATRCDAGLRAWNAAQSPESYADTAKTLAMISITNGTVTVGTMQCLCLLAYYSYTANVLHLARLHLSIAQTLLQNSGLEAEPYGGPEIMTKAKLLCWSLHVLEQIFALPRTTLAMSDVRQSMSVHFSVTGQKFTSNSIGLPRDPQSPDQAASSSIWACSASMFGIWKEVRDYVAECAEGRNVSPWTPTSSYIRICSMLSDTESNLPFHYRYKNANFLARSKNRIQQDRLFWLQWINTQFTYHTIQAVINHPFLYAQRASNHKHGPNMFWRNSSELALLHSVWITRLINMAHEKDLTIYDPHLGQCAAIAATLHLYHSRTADETFNTMARTNFDTCRSLVRQLELHWPLARQLGEDLDKLTQESFLQEGDMTQTRLSCNTSLMWAIIGYNPPSSYRSIEGLFDKTLSKPPMPPVENGTSLRPATHSRQAVELCRPDRNVATSPTWSQDDTDQDDTPLDREASGSPKDDEQQPLGLPWIPVTDEFHTMMDTDFNLTSFNFDLDGADFGECHFGTL